MVWEGGEGKGRGHAYAISRTTVLHMKRLNQTKSPVFIILCVLLFPKSTLIDFYFNEKIYGINTIIKCST